MSKGFKCLFWSLIFIVIGVPIFTGVLILNKKSTEDMVLEDIHIDSRVVKPGQVWVWVPDDPFVKPTEDSVMAVKNGYVQYAKSHSKWSAHIEEFLRDRILVRE